MTVIADTSARGRDVPPSLVEGLRKVGLATEGDRLTGEPLHGGVSSDVWRVDVPSFGSVCAKRALDRLRVAADWRAPVERSRFETSWLKTAARVDAAAVPGVIAAIDDWLVLEWLDPRWYRCWKADLLEGLIDSSVAAQLGSRVGRIHAATADSPEVADEFASDEIFDALRLDPYLRATAAMHPDRAPVLLELANRTARTRRVLVHGDVSPKNVLVGPDGPRLIDAECAWFGDPAFDVAFLVNHLLLKSVHRPDAAAGYASCVEAFVGAYLAEVVWEPVVEVQRRAATLLPGLLLARVDGKSPAEYLDVDARATVRAITRDLLVRPVDEVADVLAAVMGAIEATPTCRRETHLERLEEP